jgi:hypothetical protein
VREAITVAERGKRNSEPGGAANVGSMMQQIIHRLAQSTGCDERALTYGLIAVTSSIGGAVLFGALT